MALVQLFILLFSETSTKTKILANQRIAEAPSPGEGSFFKKRAFYKWILTLIESIPFRDDKIVLMEYFMKKEHIYS